MSFPTKAYPPYLDATPPLRAVDQNALVHLAAGENQRFANTRQLRDAADHLAKSIPKDRR